MRYAAEEVFVMFIPKKLKKAIETELEKATMRQTRYVSSLAAV